MISLRITGEARKKYRRVVAPVELVAVTGRQATSVLAGKKMTPRGGCIDCPCPPTSPNFGRLAARSRRAGKLVELFCLPCGRRIMGTTARAVALEGGELP